MGGAASQIGKLKTEVSELQGQKQEIIGAREQMKGAIRELKGKNASIKDNLNDMYGKLSQISDALSGQGVSEQAKAQLRAQKVQIIEQISMLKNTAKNINSQIKMLKKRIESMAESTAGIVGAIGMRKNILQQIAGQLSGGMMNRSKESGRVRG